MEYKLNIEEDLSLEELVIEIENGGRFVVYEYCISIFFAITLRRFSPAFLITNKNKTTNYKKKYNILSAIFGWWGIPYGPYYTIGSFRINRGGGLDFTKGIMENITAESLQNREVILETTSELFCKPDKDDKKAFLKSLRGDLERDKNIEQFVVGLFINTEEDEEEYYTIGLNVQGDFEISKEKINKALYKYFRKHTYFEYLDLREDDELNELLVEQGEVLINRRLNA